MTQVEAARQTESNRPPRAAAAGPHDAGERGDIGIVHRLRGRPSNRKLAAGWGAEDSGSRSPSLCGLPGRRWLPNIWLQDGLPVSRENPLRKWMIQQALWRPAPPARKKPCTCGGNEECVSGELVMRDSSPFRWLEDRGPACQLIALIDERVSTQPHLGPFRRARRHGRKSTNSGRAGCGRYGRPAAHYTDRNSIFRTTRSGAVGRATAHGDPARTQFGLVLLNELGNRLDCRAQSAGQGTHRERLFETLQDRLVKEMPTGGDRHHRSSQSVFGTALYSGMGAALHLRRTCESHA